jgi:hypothetical protein
LAGAGFLVGFGDFFPNFLDVALVDAAFARVCVFAFCLEPAMFAISASGSLADPRTYRGQIARGCAGPIPHRHRQSRTSMAMMATMSREGRQRIGAVPPEQRSRCREDHGLAHAGPAVRSDGLR